MGYYTITGYGMTETAVNGFERGMGIRHRLNGSVGKALGSAEYRIVKEKEGSKTTCIDYRKGSKEGLFAYLGEVLPNFDRDRVYPADAKKLIL